VRGRSGGARRARLCRLPGLLGGEASCQNDAYPTSHLQRGSHGQVEQEPRGGPDDREQERRIVGGAGRAQVPPQGDQRASPAAHPEGWRRIASLWGPDEPGPKSQQPCDLGPMGVLDIQERTGVVRRRKPGAPMKTVRVGVAFVAALVMCPSGTGSRHGITGTRSYHRGTP
jgi:hypothetical protein